MFDVYDNKTAGNDIVEYLRECADEKLCEIQKDDFISFKAKAGRRLRFVIHYGAVIFQCKEIGLVNDSHNIKSEYNARLDCDVLKADKIEMDYMFLDNTSIDLKRLDLSFDNDMSIEIMGV